MQKTGDFDTAPAEESKPDLGVVIPKDTKQESSALKDKKRAASNTRSSPQNKAIKKDYNPLSMSDEEFARDSSNKYL